MEPFRISDSPAAVFLKVREVVKLALLSGFLYSFLVDLENEAREYGAQHVTWRWAEMEV